MSITRGGQSHDPTKISNSSPTTSAASSSSPDSSSFKKMNPASPTSTFSPKTQERIKAEEQGYSPPDDPLGKYTVLLKDPLSEVTRKERRTFLGISILAIAIVKAHLVPAEITALGLKIERIEERELIFILGVMVLYFLATFVAYAFPDFLAWKIDFWKGRKVVALERMKPTDFAGVDDPQAITKLILACDAKIGSWARWSVLTSAVRATFEFILPLLVGGYALLVLNEYHQQLPNVTPKPAAIIEPAKIPQ